MDNIKSDYVTSTTGIDFKKTSSDTNGKGIYERSGTENNIYPIYYYRGTVTDNNVIFAGFCFKIVRTTETGGIRLIYNGIPTSGICENDGINSTIGESKFNDFHKVMSYVGYMYGDIYNLITDSLYNDYVFGNGISYNSTTGYYTLTGKTKTAGTNFNSEASSLNYTHYTCFSSLNTCKTVYFIFDSMGKYASYIKLENGKTLNDVYNDSFDKNNNDSSIKTYIDNWYENNLLKSYSKYLEDNIFCNDRSIYSAKKWNANGGYFNSRANENNLKFGVVQKSKLDDSSILLSCPRKIDRFTVSSSLGNGNLTYPVGLLTYDEIILSGCESNETCLAYINSNISYYTMSPEEIYANTGAFVNVYSLIFKEDGKYSFVDGTAVDEELAVRPVISLKAGTTFNYGDGTVSNPYRMS